ncbi:type II toxin-antitoxin system HicB family antitoxin [Pseudanabaena sp. UWO310]|uniref:type II toxin-antitoxin system HicB family antitoxin n=1 Tax=Pseudanabaena sp. UWO310 TaxID=2480795 RepID=UPI001157A529|nr:type II toxin-antitoxin system HicB family antitoxin [Pseudanabaena sp. UWO310]TYQ27305.1 type II toxin-antitoxin system HicB family antitoxin [Pseudanabaena sp. UWO310]
MAVKFILSDYVEQALRQATYDKLEDNSFVGRIPNCHSVIAFGETLRECEYEVQSVFEDWLFLGLKLGHHLPIISGIDLNQELKSEPISTM